MIHIMRVGDTVIITPLLRALKRRFPKSKIDLVTSKVGSQVVEHNANIHKMYHFDHKMSLGQYFSLVKNLCQNGYDLSLDLNNGYSGLRRELLALASKASKRIAFKRKGYRAVLPTDEVEYPRTHAVETFLLLGRPLGIDENERKYELFLSEEEKTWARERFKEWRVSKPVVLMNPTTLDTNKRWPADRFSWVADELVRQKEASIIITAAPEEQELARTVKDYMQEKCILLAGLTSLQQYLALIAASHLVLSVDTAAVHAAQAFDVPLVAVFNPVTYEFWKPLETSASICLVRTLGCEGCGMVSPEGPAVWKMRCTKEQRECMLSISKEEVLKACLSMLES